MNTDQMPQGVKLIQLPENVDERGRLSFAECGLHIPFDVKRIFWISDVPSGKTRGGHAHWTCHEAVFPVTGSFDIEVDDGICARTFTMDRPSVGILIPAGVWCELRNFTPNCVCVVAASQEYDATGYANDYETWKHQIKHSS